MHNQQWVATIAAKRAGQIDLHVAPATKCLAIELSTLNASGTRQRIVRRPLGSFVPKSLAHGIRAKGIVCPYFVQRVENEFFVTVAFYFKFVLDARPFRQFDRRRPEIGIR